MLPAVSFSSVCFPKKLNNWAAWLTSWVWDLALDCTCTVQYCSKACNGFLKLAASYKALAEVDMLMAPNACYCRCCWSGDKMQFARRVGLDMYRFLEGFATQASGDAILIPTNALDRYM